MNQMGEIVDLNDPSVSRFAFSSSRHVGHAVARNRAKRLLRTAVHSNLADIAPGWDCLLIARQGTPHASYGEVETAVNQLLTRSQIRVHLMQPGGSSAV